MDDFIPKRDEPYKSSRDSYKSSREEFKREPETSRHSSSAYGGSSRFESTTALSKDRYSDRAAIPDYRATASRSDDRDARNGSSKPRYLDPPVESRFSDRSVVATGSTWGTTLNFGAPPANVWAPKQPEANAGEWRGGLEEKLYRFQHNERKPAIVADQFLDATVRTNQFPGSNSSIIPDAARYTNNRYNNGRF